MLKKSDTKLILLLLGIFTILRVFNSLKMYFENRVTIDLEVFFSTRILAWVISIVFAVIIVKTTRYLLRIQMAWWRIFILHILAAVGITFVWFASYILINWVTCLDGNCESLEGFWTWYLNNFDNLLSMYLFASSFTYAWHYIQRANVQRLRNEEMERQLTHTRLKMLQSQLHPHFLFNTLNSITSLIGSDDEKARDMIADLSDLLRQCLDNNNGQVITLEEEMQLLQKYIDIEKTRFAEQLQVKVNVENNLQQATIPAMLLQPLVENAIQHGFSRQHPNLNIEVAIFQKNKHLHIHVKDNGKGLEDMDNETIFEQGTGLSNTQERLQTLYEDAFTFRVKNAKTGVLNEIIIPLFFATLS